MTKSQYTSNVEPYIEGMLSVMEEAGYKPGIYGPKPVCKKFRGSHKATERYTFVCDNDWGKSGWSATEQDFDDWSLRQYDWNKTLEGASPVVIDECEAKSIALLAAGSCNALSGCNLDGRPVKGLPFL